MRLAFLLVALVCLMSLGVMDICVGNMRPGIAAVMLAVANGLLLL